MRYGRALIGSALAVAAMVCLLGAPKGAAQTPKPEADKAEQKPEVKALLDNLIVDKPRAYKNMLVFPIRWTGKQAPGDWETMDKAVTAGHLRITEKAQASVNEVQMENTGDSAVFLMSGEIIKGGQQTRVIQKDTVIEARQKAAVPVFCVEQHRWAGKKEFENSRNIAPSSVRGAIQSGAGQSEVWDRAAKASDALRAPSATGSLDESLNAPKVQKDLEAMHKELGKFSPPETVGIAIADARTGRVIGLELFGRRDLFENLQEKLTEGYAVDLVLTAEAREAKQDVGEKQVMEFIKQALAGHSQYEKTPGSGRGVELTGGDLHGKGVAVGEAVIHISIQETKTPVTPAKPIIRDAPVMYEPRPPTR